MEIGSVCIPSAVHATGLFRTYRRGAENIQALKGIDLDVKCGEFVGVVGHSGAGKTTMLNLIGLMDRPTEGKLEVLGTDVRRRAVPLDALRRKNIDTQRNLRAIGVRLHVKSFHIRGISMDHNWRCVLLRNDGFIASAKISAPLYL